MFIRKAALAASLVVSVAAADNQQTEARPVTNQVSEQLKTTEDRLAASLLGMLSSVQDGYERRFHLMEEAEQWLRKGHALEALGVVDQLIKFEPRNSEAFSLRSTILSNLKREDEGIAESARAFQLAQTPRQKARAISAKALNISSQGRNSEALTIFTEALKHDPSYATAHFERARIFARLNMYADVGAEVEKANKISQAGIQNTSTPKR